MTLHDSTARASKGTMPLDAPDMEQLRSPRSVETWLGVFSRVLRLSPAKRDEITAELGEHLRERTRDLMLEGLDEGEALTRATTELGEAADLARRFERANPSRRRKLLMNLGILSLGAGAVTMGVMTAGHFSNTESAPVRSVYEQAATAEEPPEWFDTKREFSMSGDMAFGDAIDFIQQSTDMSVVVHWRDLAEKDVTAESGMTATFENVSFRRALDLMFDAVEADWAEIEWRIVDGVMEIGTREGFDEKEVELIVYDVSGIITSLWERYSYEHDAAIEAINDLLVSFVSPEDWEDNGGILAHLRVVGGSMFVEAPARMHEKIEWILTQLRSGEGEWESQLQPENVDGPDAEGDALTLSPGDEVVVQIYEFLQANTMYREHRRIERDGTIRLSRPIGAMQAAGRTLDELEQALVQLLADAEIMRDPQVSVYTPTSTVHTLSAATPAEQSPFEEHLAQLTGRTLELSEELASIDAELAILESKGNGRVTELDRQHAEASTAVKSLDERLVSTRIELTAMREKHEPEHASVRSAMDRLHNLMLEREETLRTQVQRNIAARRTELQEQRDVIQARLRQIDVQRAMLEAQRRDAAR